MQISAAGNRRLGWNGQKFLNSSSLAMTKTSTSRGFTLLELLVVVAIIAMASAGVGFAMRDTSQVALERDAERLAALLESARARSRVSGVPVRWRAMPTGFRFEGLAPSAQPDSDLPEQWLDPNTRVADSPATAPAPTLLLGPEPIIEPQQVVLVSRTQPGKSVRLATDGVRPFAVLAGAP
jgi:general secretion pathway protein H